MVHLAGIGAALALVGCGPDVGPLRDLDAERAAPARAEDAGLVSADGGVSPRPVSFARDLRPILARDDGPPAGCKRCHYRGEPAPQGFQLGGLDMTTLAALRRGGVSSGKDVIVPGDPSRSVLVQKLEGTYARGARMPKDLTPLAREEIELFRRWIAEGAIGADDE